MTPDITRLVGATIYTVVSRLCAAENAGLPNTLTPEARAGYRRRAVLLLLDEVERVTRATGGGVRCGQSTSTG
jgi:hypothetical protein